jgi:hypothetical protein
MEREETASTGGNGFWEDNCQREEWGDVSGTCLGFNNRTRTASCELGSHKPETVRHERKAGLVPNGLKPVIHLSKVYFHHPPITQIKCYVIYLGVRPGLVLE